MIVIFASLCVSVVYFAGALYWNHRELSFVMMGLSSIALGALFGVFRRIQDDDRAFGAFENHDGITLGQFRDMTDTCTDDYVLYGEYPFEAVRGMYCARLEGRRTIVLERLPMEENSGKVIEASN